MVKKAGRKGVTFEEAMERLEEMAGGLEAEQKGLPF